MDAANGFSVFDHFAGGLIYSPPTALGAAYAYVFSLNRKQIICACENGLSMLCGFRLCGSRCSLLARCEHLSKHYHKHSLHYYHLYSLLSRHKHHQGHKLTEMPARKIPQQHESALEYCSIALTGIKSWASWWTSSSRSEVLGQLRSHERRKKAEYGPRIVNIERASFTPLVFTTQGLAAPECAKFLSTLATYLSRRHTDIPYSILINRLRVRISFCLLRWTVTCFRGCRASYQRRRQTSFLVECRQMGGR